MALSICLIPTSPSSIAAMPPSPSLLRRVLHLRHHRQRRFAVAASVRQDTSAWVQAPITTVTPASSDGSLFHLSLDLSDSPDLANSYSYPGQYLQLRPAAADKPSFLAIASPPSIAREKRLFEFLVKKVPGSVAEVICGLGRGDHVEISGVMGKGFHVDRIQDADTVLIFATGSGISPIRSLIESGFRTTVRSDVRLYYGARNLQRMAYQDRFKDWESTGIKIIPVLSRPEDEWGGERGYVQAAFSRAKQISDPSSTGAVLCGQKQMTEEITSVLVADGVSRENILLNF